MATGFLKFDHDHTVYIDLDLATDEVRKAVIIDADDVETPICGGGTGGLTIANVTLSTTNIGEVGLYMPLIITGSNNKEYINDGYATTTGDPETYRVPVGVDGLLVDYSGNSVVSSTGDVEVDADNTMLLITGDCSIVMNNVTPA